MQGSGSAQSSHADLALAIRKGHQESNQGSSGVLTLAIGTKDMRHARGCWRRTLELRPQLGRVEARFHSEPRERRQQLQHGRGKGH